MPLVMVMDFVVKADAYVHLIIITKRTALFMAVSSSFNPVRGHASLKHLGMPTILGF